MTHISPVPWYAVAPYSQVLSELDGSLYTVLNVDITQCPHIVTAESPTGQIVIRTVDPWTNAHIVYPDAECEAIATLGRYFTLSEVRQ